MASQDWQCVTCGERWRALALPTECPTCHGLRIRPEEHVSERRRLRARRRLSWALSDGWLVWLTLTLTLLLPACSLPVVREPSAYTAGVLAALSREEEMARALLDAASRAAATGDRARCVAYATPALLSEGAAKAQAFRALYLAGLPYPGAADPPADPGPSRPARPVDAVCGPAPAPEVP